MLEHLALAVVIASAAARRLFPLEISCMSVQRVAMLLEAIKPGRLKGANGDEQYLAVVQRFGDPTDASAQLRAPAHFGATARLVQDGDIQLIEQQMYRNIPVPLARVTG